MSTELRSLKLEDFGARQERYQPMKLARRAAAALTDAEPALKRCGEMLTTLAKYPKIGKALDNLRANPLVAGKMRPSEAKNLLMEGGDYITAVQKKMAAWRKTMERVGQGEGILAQNGQEYIPLDSALAMAVIGISGASNYLSMVQLALPELAKLDGSDQSTSIAEIRRCATILSDCELAAGLSAAIR